ncbi:Oidioi.mRNA.OKI2018_I69.PAR.g11869.t1.cds [Oikopleura dioica]|uniref:Oidioi.mRNA.OKI2018_I69.PAR.g11869.t1.cds n=1 Tax=Oikopleura dioica TaxID=34765 RepID=A0ABN7S4F4_OIKDI|nr:Oidioi.mRNA.OKI2018_I69.PAR.g11869.t1.cds [Oikopleura dioica]
MADLEAVLADVSYLMAMEKSKSSTSSTKNGRRLTLPDRDSAHVIRRYLTERDLLQFHKVFNERLGFELFAAFCKRKKFNQKAHFHVPMLFYRQIEEFKSSNIEPEDRHNLAREIYDTFVKRELIERQKRQRENDGSPDCNYSPAESPSTKSRKSPMSTSPLEPPPSPGIKTISGFEQSSQEVRHILENDDVIIEPTVFDPFHCALLDLFKRTAWPLFTESREFTRYCQWKNIGSFY